MFYNGKLDLVAAIWGRPEFIDSLVWTVISYRRSGNLCDYVHVGCPHRFEYEGLDLERDLGIIQHPASTPISSSCPLPRWYYTPILPSDRNYLMIEADMAFQKPININSSTGNIIQREEWVDQNNMARRHTGYCVMSLLSGDWYNRIISICKGLMFNASFVGTAKYMDEYHPHIYLTAFQDMSDIETSYNPGGISLDEIIFSHAISVAQHNCGFKFDIRGFHWGGGFIKFESLDSVSHYENHLDLVLDRYKDMSICHLSSGELLYNGRGRGSWIL